jgi:hypothetical protein
MSTFGSLVSVHLAGEGKDEISLDTLPGKFTVTRTDEALPPYGGLAAWSGFLKHLGLIKRLADQCRGGNKKRLLRVQKEPGDLDFGTVPRARG